MPTPPLGIHTAGSPHQFILAQLKYPLPSNPLVDLPGRCFPRLGLWFRQTEPTYPSPPATRHNRKGGWYFQWTANNGRAKLSPSQSKEEVQGDGPTWQSRRSSFGRFSVWVFHLGVQAREEEQTVLNHRRQGGVRLTREEAQEDGGNLSVHPTVCPSGTTRHGEMGNGPILGGTGIKQLRVRPNRTDQRRSTSDRAEEQKESWTYGNRNFMNYSQVPHIWSPQDLGTILFSIGIHKD